MNTSNERFKARLFYPQLEEGDAITLMRLKALLRTGASVKCDCFNQAEVEILKAQLDDTERARVKFTWLTFPDAAKRV